MKAILTITVEIDSDDEEDILEAAVYCDEALSWWGGQRHPSDWLFDGVRVKSIKHAGKAVLEGKRGE